MNHKKIAELAHVSASTVSKALSGSKEVSEETAKKIKAIITAIRQKFPREGISSFYYKVEE